LRWFPEWAVTPTVLIIGALLFLPAVFCPLFLDDYLQAAMVRGTFPARRGPFELYNFIDDSVRRALFEQGALPWWTAPNIKLKFLRPLSSAILWFDHSYLQRPVLMHLHSLAWWMAASLAARVLFRRLFSERVATIAFIIFALAPCHALPLAWLANRETIVAVTFGTLGLASYIRFRRDARSTADGWTWAAVSAACFSLAMLSGEYAICVGGYVVAFEVFRRGDTLLRRGVGLLPFALPAGAYLVCRQLGGYGARSSGFYTDPFFDASAFLDVAPTRLLGLVGDGWVSPEFDLYRPHWLGLPALAIPIALVYGPVRRAFDSLDEARKNAVSFMAVGSVLSLVPVLSVIPSCRLLEASMLGIAAAVASFLDIAWFRREALGRVDRRMGLAGLLIGFAHLVHGPAMCAVAGSAVYRRASGFVEHASFVRDNVNDFPGQRLVFVRAPEELLFLPYALMAEGVSPPKLLAMTDAPHVLLLSKSSRTINALVPSDKSLVRLGEGTLFRDDTMPLKKGSTFTFNGMRATVLEMGEAGPTSARFVFDEDYDSSDLEWATTGSKVLRTLDPPGVGFGLPVE
jgi:hypothetical protein